MPKICYDSKNFRADSMRIIETAEGIMEEYEAQGFDLTLRQLYYQFVARGLLENTDKQYKRLGGIVSDARLAGLLDWGHIVDRTRVLKRNSHWSSPADIVWSCAHGYAIDKWRRQPTRCEVWIEKDALSGVLQSCCPGLDVAYFSCRGYSSQSAMWRAAQRLKSYEGRQRTVIFHLGDHDPSGIDMTRDIKARLKLFDSKVEVRRIALNMDQVEQYQPPPNPAKLSDTRARDYIDRFGNESWELDALEPAVLVGLVREAVEGVRDDDLWQDAVQLEEDGRDQLRDIADNWEDVLEAWDDAR